jgi:hypothetical protein
MGRPDDGAADTLQALLTSIKQDLKNAARS